MKRIVQTITALLLTLSLAIPAYAKPTDHRLMLDGSIVDLQHPILMENGYNLVPLREIMEILGANLTWLEDSKTIEASRDGNEVVLTIGTTYATLNGEEMTLDTEPVIYDSRTYVPIGFFARALGFIIDWNTDTKTVIIKTPAKEVAAVELGYKKRYETDLTYEDAVAKALKASNDLKTFRRSMEDLQRERDRVAEQYSLTGIFLKDVPGYIADTTVKSILSSLEGMTLTLENKKIHHRNT